MMRILGSVVAPSASFMPVREPEIMDGGSIRSQVVRDQFIWDIAIFSQQLAHQFQRRALVPPALDQHVEDLTLGVDGAPKIDHAAIDFQIDFIQMPGRMRLGSTFAQIGGYPSVQSD